MARLWKIFAVCLLLLFLYVGAMFYGNPIAKFYFNKDLELYLKEQYKEKIVIEKIDYSFKQSTSLIDEHYIAVVHPESDSNLKIIVYKGYDGNLKSYYQ
jgi:hypothetical protein